ncbi:hypothetical protein [Paraburkholderia caribensis]|uniref:hypothetical protein n=1 Tax=Paraburkholderia caribensis TaxID=75105 RepID=UPI00078DEBDC|nr:hypothetical protein [Paraburkholderia caribensis]AMV47795.1 hypothetical protein ATN79_44825 [Paraburkholderia caribensis]
MKAGVVRLERKVAVTRVKTDAEEQDKFQAIFTTHLHDVAERLGSELHVKHEPAKPREINDSTSFERIAGLKNLFHMNPLPVLDFDLAEGTQLFSPPFDKGWQEGAGSPLSQLDGTSIVVGADGFSASGFGVFLRADAHVSVSVMPQGQFRGGWLNFDGASPLRSSGGSGAVVYNGETVVLQRLATVWNVQDPPNYAHANFDLPFSDTATPPAMGTFGPVTIGPVIFDMFAGQQNLVWFYIWQLNASIEKKNFLVFDEAKIPLISVTVTPPIFIH